MTFFGLRNTTKSEEQKMTQAHTSQTYFKCEGPNEKGAKGSAVVTSLDSDHDTQLQRPWKKPRRTLAAERRLRHTEVLTADVQQHGLLLLWRECGGRGGGWCDERGHFFVEGVCVPLQMGDAKHHH